MEAGLRRSEGRLDGYRGAAECDQGRAEEVWREGDAGFEEIVREHAGEVARVAGRFGLRPKEVEDVSQEVFIRVWRGLRRFRGDASLRSWILRIAVRESSRYMSRGGRRESAVSMGSGDTMATPGAGPADAASQREEKRKLREALGGLSQRHREAVVLRYLEGLSCSEVAEVLGCSLGTVHSRLYHARQKLKGIMEVL